MFEVELNGETFRGEVSFYTALLYEQEFKRKMVQDYMNGQDYRQLPKLDAEGNEVKGESVLVLDFESIDWLVVMRVLWAALKTASDDVAPFEAWMRGVTDADLWDVRNLLDPLVADCFFRSAASGAQG